MNPRRTFSRKLSRTGWHLVLALVMLLMQQAGLHHAFEHAGHEDEAAHTHAACLQCAAHHAQGHALAPTPLEVAMPTGSHVLRAAAMHGQRTHGVQLNYRARAPPSFVSA